MRPGTAELLVFEMMRAPIFATGRCQHSRPERSPIHVIPQVVAGQFVQRYGATAPDLRAKTVAVEHLKTSRFPPPPFPRVAQVANWNVGRAKVKVDQSGTTLAVNIPTFNHDPPIASRLFRNRINFERFDKRSRGVRQTLRNEEIHQRFSISEIEHGRGYSLTPVFFEIRTPTGVQSSQSGNEIVSPGLMMRSSALTSRFFSSRSNSSGMPVSTGKVP